MTSYRSSTWLWREAISQLIVDEATMQKAYISCMASNKSSTRCTILAMEVYTESRPWGMFEKFHENQLCTVKLIYVNPNSRLSLQYHNKRSEFWKIVSGTAHLQIDGKSLILREGQTVEIPKRAKHRIEAKETKCVILEISYGSFDEDDIIRLEDDYERKSPGPKQ